MFPQWNCLRLQKRPWHFEGAARDLEALPHHCLCTCERLQNLWLYTGAEKWNSCRGHLRRWVKTAINDSLKFLADICRAHLLIDDDGRAVQPFCWCFFKPRPLLLHLPPEHNSLKRIVHLKFLVHPISTQPYVDGGSGFLKHRSVRRWHKYFV